MNDVRPPIRINPAAILFVGAPILALSLIIIAMLLYPQYRVYSMRLQGEALLAKAQAERQVLVRQAEAERDAAVHRAAAIAIVGQAAKDFPEYRQQEFIGAFADALHNGKIAQMIYVPTEAGIPILEAGRATR
jgi:hypothetical protein